MVPNSGSGCTASQSCRLLKRDVLAGPSKSRPLCEIPSVPEASRHVRAPTVCPQARMQTYTLIGRLMLMYGLFVLVNLTPQDDCPKPCLAPRAHVLTCTMPAGDMQRSCSWSGKSGNAPGGTLLMLVLRWASRSASPSLLTTSFAHPEAEVPRTMQDLQSERHLNSLMR